MIGNEAAVTPVSQDVGMCGDVCDLDKVHLFSVFRQDYRVVLFLSCPILVTEWPCLLVSWGIVCSLGETAQPAPGWQGLLFRTN